MVALSVASREIPHIAMVALQECLPEGNEAGHYVLHDCDNRSDMERPMSIAWRPPLFEATVSPRPAYQAIRARALLESSQLIGRARTTMNHSDIRGSEPHDHDSSGAASV
jgi:hypothetical protein